MRISASLRSGYGHESGREAVGWMIDRTIAAREAGLTGLYVGDHHVAGTNYLQNSVVLARLLAEWDQRAGALFLLPLWHPVLVAEQVGSLASMATGPFILQCAIGGGPEQFAGMGIDMRRRVRDFEASLDIITRLLAGETVTAETPHPIQGAHIRPTPPDGVEVWIGADADKAIGRAARLGDTWYAGPGLTHDQAEAKLAHYRTRCAAHDRDPDRLPIRRDVYVADSSDDAEAMLKRITGSGYRGLDPTALAIGTPDEVAEHFRRLGDIGYTEIVVRQVADAQDDALASYRRLGDVVDAVT